MSIRSIVIEFLLKVIIPNIISYLNRKVFDFGTVYE